MWYGFGSFPTTADGYILEWVKGSKKKPEISKNKHQVCGTDDCVIRGEGSAIWLPLFGNQTGANVIYTR